MSETQSCDAALDRQIEQAARVLGDSIVSTIGEMTVTAMACELLVAMLVSLPAVLVSYFV
jgi:hypothetical protein